MKILTDANPRKAILFAPLIFVLHVVEEYPGFVEWFNTLVQDGITQPLFLTVNGVGLVITIIVTALMANAEGNEATILTLAWLSFLMFANSLLHLTATIVHEMYAPGAITSVVLYLPYFTWFVWLAVTKLNVKPVSVLLTMLIASTPMFVHGYLIIFKGDRLF